nr:hypothetical protein [Tanacetum cinerariifolium]
MQLFKKVSDEKENTQDLSKNTKFAKQPIAEILPKIGLDNTKTRRPQPRSNTKTDRLPSASKSSRSKNKEVKIEEHHRNLLLSKKNKHMNQKANVSKNETQKEYWPKVSKSKNVGPRESLATPKPRKPRFLLRWSPTGKMFDSGGKIVAPSGDNACTYNTMEPKIKRFPNSTSLLGSVLAYGVDLVLEKEFASFALQVLKIHSLMNQLRILTMILQTLSTHHYSPRHTLVSYVKTIITTYHIDHQPPIIQEDLNQKLISDEFITKLRNELFTAIQSVVEMSCQREQAANERTIPLRDIVSQLPSSIVITTSSLLLPIEDPKDSLIMGNEELSTIPEKKSDEFIKSSVEDLVPIPSESEDTFGSDSECILPLCDDFSPINVFKEKSVTFSNPLVDSNDDFTSSDDESLSDEDVPEDNVLEDIECKDSYNSNLDESTFLVTPLSDVNEDEYFTPGDGIELLRHRDPSTPIVSIVSILERFTDEPPLEENDDLFELESKKNEWKKILYDAPIDDLMIEDKVFYPRIHDNFFSNILVSPFLLSSGSEDTIFDPENFAFHFSHRSNCSDFEDSRAHGFVHRLLELLSLACLYMGIRYPRSY